MRIRWRSSPFLIFSCLAIIFIYLFNLTNPDPVDYDEHFLARAVKKQLDNNHVLSKNSFKENIFKDEHDIIPSSTFTKDRLYHIENGIESNLRTNILKHQPDKFKDVQEVIVHSAHILRFESRQNTEDKLKLDTLPKDLETTISQLGLKTARYEDFISGTVRTESDRGTQYQLLFNDGETNTIKKLELFRPFAPLQHVETKTIDMQSRINFIMPLSGRIDMFKQFLKNFIANGDNENVHLTIAYFGDSTEIKSLLETYKLDLGFSSWKIIELKGEFNRGRALNAGAESMRSDDDLMLFIDVDIGFTKSIFNVCRSYPEKSKSVYFPIVFSLYNPSSNFIRKSTERQKIVLHQDYGYWRHFGYGMSCLYKYDYDKVNGFNKTIEGWGMEDIDFYRKFVESGYHIVRAPEKSLVHYWHEKSCSGIDKERDKEQYVACLKSKALNEGNQISLGLQLFQKQNG